MEFWDLFRKHETPKQSTGRSSVATQQKKTVSSPTVQSADQHCTKGEKISLKVTDKEKIIRGIELIEKPDDINVKFYCAVRPARIFCHSILIDKLGDLTKFIISSLYEEHSIDEVMGLTQMGNTTVKEEVDYLIRGGLVNDDRKLTELGKQYGRLLERFDELSEGIDVAFNTFADAFELAGKNRYCSEAEQEYILPNRFIPTLARNDNYANSLDIAKKQIGEDISFSHEIKNSLYTTVKIEKSTFGYKRVVLSDFSGCDAEDRETSIKIAIPYDRIQCRPRYTWIDPYRSILSNLRSVSEEHTDLLTDKANLIVKASTEEDDADIITVDVDTITGKLNFVRDLSDEEHPEEAMIKLNRVELHLTLDGDDYNGMYLEEVRREKQYKVRSFPYRRMEAQ